MATAAFITPDLPWSIHPEDQRRFRRILTVILAACLALSLAAPFLPVPEIERERVEQIPPRLARLIIEKKQPPPPPPAPVVKAEPKQPEPKPEPAKAPEVKKKTEAARKTAERSGLLAFKDELADLRDKSVSSSVLKNQKLQKAGATAEATNRSLITANAAQGSRGIQTAGLSRDTGGGSLAGRTVTQVQSTLGAADPANVRRSGNSRKASRTVEDLQLVFDKNKGAIYALYNRELRKDPSLQGKLVLELTIAPSGKVTNCRIVSSDLESPDLERKVVARVKLFDFGNKDVDVMITTYPIDFLPS